MILPESPPERARLPFVVSLGTRWSDNDVLGHLNNNVYSRFFEEVVVAFFLEHLELDLALDREVPVLAEGTTRYVRSLSYPDQVDVGLAVESVGTTSFILTLALYKAGEMDAAAHGRARLVFIDRVAKTSAPVPARLLPVLKAHAAS